jgi:predicted dehydrogenase
MIDAARIDLLIVCTPHPAHVEPAVAAASRGVHVLVEKPLASSLADCDAMINAARASGAKLGVVSQRRFYEPVVRVRQAIDAGKIGRPVLASTVMYGWRDEAYYRSDPWRGQWLAEGGGVLVNQAPHQLDLFQWLMGPIDELFGYWGNLNHPTIEVEDTAVAVVRFKNGGMGTIMVSNSQKPGIYAKVHIHGDSGATVGVQPEGGAMFIAGMTSILEPPLNDLWTVPGEESLLAGWQQADREAFAQVDPTTHYIGLQLHDFVRAIIEDRAPAVTGDDGRVTVELFTAIYRSQRDGRPVKFPVRAADTADDFDGRLTAR